MNNSYALKAIETPFAKLTLYYILALNISPNIMILKLEQKSFFIPYFRYDFWDQTILNASEALQR
ncbi:CLUMA_CG007224, isoform A [Clunio marinus]|uniref:CLUMA_CG007224, isoform A n=1 Tax=Clunio marinus TaxID=568069 RepID=A0A1J1I026_9DIPT|nr:CLUMA_CG007224, isoform A [Clunio marinus]